MIKLYIIAILIILINKEKLQMKYSAAKGVVYMGRVVCEVIPYRNFKEKIRLTKAYRSNRIDCYSDYLVVYFRERREDYYGRME